MPTAGTRLVIVRHGHSVAQAEGFASGHATCRGLSDAGRLQVGALRDRLLAHGELDDTAAVYTSILPRAIETAAILRDGLAGNDAAAACEWCEIHAGEAEGRAWRELVEELSPTHVEHPDRQSADVFSGRIPGAETWAECFARVGARLHRAADDHPGERVVVVGHGGTIGASFVALGGWSEGEALGITHEASNASLTEWRALADGTWRLVRFNDAAHLRTLA